MRVLHVYKTYYPDSVGGVEKVIRRICVGTVRLCIVNEVLTFGDAMRYLWNNLQRARAMGRCAEARCWQLFSAAQMSASYAALYHELAARHAPLTLARSKKCNYL